MGGDGGTKAVNRAYLRGAGAASTTGDHPSLHHNNNGADKHMAAQEASRAMQYCYISDQPLQFNDDNNNSSSITSSQLLSTSKIVTCRYGRLYNKEAAIEALLQRRQRTKSTKAAAIAATTSEAITTENDVLQSRLGRHIRGLKDLYPVRFQTIHDDTTNTVVVPVCPITGRELNGRIVAYALVPGHPDTTTVNVVSEYALKQLSEQDVLTEYGATKKIRLLAPSSLYETIDQEYNKETEATSSTTGGSGKKRKLKHDKKLERDVTVEEQRKRQATSGS